MSTHPSSCVALPHHAHAKQRHWSLEVWFFWLQPYAGRAWRLDSGQAQSLSHSLGTAVMGACCTCAADAAPVDLAEVLQQWDGFTAALQQYDALLDQQRVQLQASIKQQVEAFRGTVDGFASRCGASCNGRHADRDGWAVLSAHTAAEPWWTAQPVRFAAPAKHGPLPCAWYVPCRWAALKPTSGPSGNPAVVLAQIEDCSRQLEDLRAEADKYAKVREHVVSHVAASSSMGARGLLTPPASRVTCWLPV